MSLLLFYSYKRDRYYYWAFLVFSSLSWSSSFLSLILSSLFFNYSICCFRIRLFYDYYVLMGDLKLLLLLLFVSYNITLISLIVVLVYLGSFVMMSLTPLVTLGDIEAIDTYLKWPFTYYGLLLIEGESLENGKESLFF